MSRRAALITLIVTLVVAWGSAIVTQLTGVRPLLGLDLQGGFSVLLEAPDDTDSEVLDLAVEVIRRRIEALGGVQEPEVAVAGPRSIEVQLPGVTDRQRALDAVGTTGQLAFRPVLEANALGVSPLLIAAQEYADSTTTTTTSTTTTTVPGETTTTTAGEDTTTTSSTTTTTVPAEPPDLTPVLPEGITVCVPGGRLDEQPGCVSGETGLTLSDDAGLEAWLRDPRTGEVFHLAPARVLGSDLSDAQAAFVQQGAGGGVPWGVSTGGVGQWVVSLEFNSEGADKFEEVTKELAGYGVGDDRRRFAIVLDGVVQSAPQMDEEITPETGIPGGRAVITMGTAGNPEQSARDLSVVLRYGALPVAFEQASVQSISATLGRDSLQAGLVAGAIGLGLVAIAMLLYYRVLGLVNLLGLTVFGSLVLVIISVLGETQGVTLTLAGVAGVIVSIGITADSYILYFERIKEEVRQGRSLRAAIDQGFTASFRTILTANTVALAAAVLLFMLAVGAVKGFALALGIATVVNVIVAQIFTRPAVALLGLSPLGEGGRFSVRGAAGTAREVTQ